MKLIFCQLCCDLIQLKKEPKKCECGKVGGVYKSNGVDAVYFGQSAVMIGICNNSLARRIKSGPSDFNPDDLFSGTLKNSITCFLVKGTGKQSSIKRISKKKFDILVKKKKVINNENKN